MLVELSLFVAEFFGKDDVVCSCRVLELPRGVFEEVLDVVGKLAGVS
jgi:hypothetical protein